MPPSSFLLFFLLTCSLELFLNAIREFGSHVPKDYASGDALGAFWVPSTLDAVNRTRSFAYTAHYDRVRTRTNFHLLINNKVTQITFSGKTATGVKVRIDRVYMFQLGSSDASEFLPIARNCSWRSRPVGVCKSRGHCCSGCSAHTTNSPTFGCRT